MAKTALPVFTRDHRTGSMKELTSDGHKESTLASDEAIVPHFRVLVADNDETDRLLTIWHLGKAWPVERDMMVECAADGAEALEKIRSDRFELVVLDWNMPHQDGAAVLRAMRESGLRVPVVVVSGQRHKTIASDLEAMAAAFVNKNELDPTSFRSAISASIQLQEGRCSLDSDLRAT
jgi:CheY-like chemotaxis protein